MILLSSYQYIRQIFKTSEIVSITAKQYILKGIQDKNSVATFWLTNFSLLFAADVRGVSLKISFKK